MRPLAALVLFFSLLGGAARAAEIRGTVFDANEKPVPAAVVELTTAAGPARTARSDAAGRYRFPGVAAGRCTLVASKEGFTTSRQVITVANGAQVLGAYFHIRPWAGVPWCITGTVKDEATGRPIPKAKLSLTLDAMPGRLEGIGEADTNAAGAYGFAELKAGRYQIRASAAGYLRADPVWTTLSAGANRQKVNLALSPPPPESTPGTLALRLTDTQGQPLVNRDVTVRIRGLARNCPVAWQSGLEQENWRDRRILDENRMLIDLQGAAKTDGAGQVKLTLPPGRFTVTVRGKGLLAQEKTAVVPPAGRAVAVAFALPPAKTAAALAPEKPENPGAAAGAPAGPPAPEPAEPRAPEVGLRVTILRPDGKPLGGTGVYAFVGLPADPAHPWGGAEAVGDQGDDQLAPAYHVTDAAGRVTIPFPAPGQAALLAVKTRGFAEVQADKLTIPQQGFADVTVRLAGPSLNAAGRVTGDGGKPVAGARVFAYRVIGKGQDDRFWSALRYLWLPKTPDVGPWPYNTPLDELKPGVVPGLLLHAVSYAETGADGKFTLAELDGGTYHFGVMAPGWSRASREKQELAAGKPAPALAFALQPLGSIEGVVLRPDGTPLALAEVRLSRSAAGGPPDTRPDEAEREDVSAAHTGKDGRYRLADVEPGTYRLVLRRQGYRPAVREKVEVAAGKAAGADFRLDAGVTLQGRALKPDGTPAGDALVTVSQATDPEGGSASAVAGADGEFTVSGLAPGKANVRLGVPGFAGGRQEVTLPQPAGAVAEVRLPKGVALRGTVRDEQGKPLAGASVYWYPAAATDPEDFMQPETRQAETDADGSYAFASIPPGKVSLRVTLDGYRTASPVQELAAKADQVKLDVKLEMLRYGKLRGRVVRADGKPAAGVQVTIGPADQEQQVVRTDAQGAFVAAKVPTGAGSVSISPEEERIPRGSGRRWQYTVKQDEETVMEEIRLPAAGTIAGVVRGREKLAEKPRMLAVMPFAVPLGPDGKPVPPSQATRLYVPMALDLMRGDPTRSPLKPGLPGEFLIFSGVGMAHAVYPAGTQLAFSIFEGMEPSPLKPDGAFEIKMLPAGPCRLCLLTEQGNDGGVIMPLASVTVAADQTARVTLDVPETGTVAGKITGAPVQAGMPALWIYSADTMQLAGGASAQKDGAFSLSGFAPGSYVASVWLPEKAGVRRSFTVTAGQTTQLDLAPAAGVALRGKVGGALPRNLYVSAESDTGFGGAAVAGDGAFSLDHVLPGTYTLTLWAPGEAKLVTLRDVKVGDAGAEGVEMQWK